MQGSGIILRSSEGAADPEHSAAEPAAVRGGASAAQLLSAAGANRASDGCNLWSA